MSVLAFPAGACCRILHRAVDKAEVGKGADLLIADTVPMWRNLRGQTAPVPFEYSLNDMKLDMEDVAPGALLQELE